MQAKNSTDEVAAKSEEIIAKAKGDKVSGSVPAAAPYMQNRELSWLTFDERVLDQGSDPSVPLLERLQFVSIFCSNLQEFFMVRVGSLTDMLLLKKEVRDSKSMMTPREQLDAIYARCHELYPIQEKIYHDLEKELDAKGVHHLRYSDLSAEQAAYLHTYMTNSVIPFLSPQIINARHPFPHLENGALYIIVRLMEGSDKPKEQMTKEERQEAKEARKKQRDLGAEGVTLGLIPLPKKSPRVIKLPGEGFNYILLEDALQAAAGEVFNMYQLKHTNIICVTRNADLDATEGADEREEDYREHMKRILKKRGRLAPVRLESKNKLSSTVREFLLKRLNLLDSQVYTTGVPFDMGYAFGLPGMVDADTRAALTSSPFSPVWPGCVRHDTSVIEQLQSRELLVSYPYESMDPFVQLLREASVDPEVVSIKITLYRLASQSHLAEALIAAAENGKEVTALFELRARFDESNNIEWSQRFEEAGAKVIYGFHDLKVHSKICCITRNTDQGLQYITQLGTGNYNEKTAKLYTDFSYMTTDAEIGRDAMEFFQNMGLENASRNYQTLWVAPLQIKQNVIEGIDKQIALAKDGKPCGLFFKTNSITDKEVIEKLTEASQAGVPITMLVRGISCLVPQVKGYTENVHIVSIVGRLLEHSRIYGFGSMDSMSLYLSSADLMTRNMDKRVEIAWPIRNEELREQVLHYIATCLKDTAKLRELKSDGTWTALGSLADGAPFNAQETLIEEARISSKEGADKELSEKTPFEKLRMQAQEVQKESTQTELSDLEDVFREALKHEMPEESLEELANVAAAVVAAAGGKVVAADEAPADAPAAVEAKPQPAAAPVAVQPEKPKEPAPGTSAATAPVKHSEPVPERKASAANPKPVPAPPKKKGFFGRLFGGFFGK